MAAKSIKTELKMADGLEDKIVVGGNIAMPQAAYLPGCLPAPMHQAAYLERWVYTCSGLSDWL